ncbi:HAUS augmin-like complex subunit 6 isoform X7 [Falco biarmicus]|uniref:HAUS augmin-like complex subunit 6 isoform X7 n=1 Tax=Falco biarmicus TaxID=345155 RepID=UPI0024BC29DB|nr:HAUS augmin-like complex subunit 6 isoform X7 [Falco biarmicus]
MGSRWEMEDFWLYVGALGFDPGAGNASSGLGGVAFDASYTQFLAIAHFIFTKLDQNLAEESLKNCGYSLFFAVPQFWKNYCRRLKDVADEDEGCVLQIPASVFSFPLGPKLIHMFYQLARRVVIKELKNDSVGTDVPFAVELSPEYMYMADVRHRVAYNKLLTVFQREDFVLQEYEEKAQILIKERKRIESEYAVLKMQFCKTEQHDQNKTDRTEKIKKVRSMWTLVIEMLASLKKEKEEVDSVLDVLEDCAGQCVLDGANVFSVPRLLCDRVKSDGCQHCTGNIYEAENLNFLTVIKLLNEAQRALRDEHCQCDLSQLLQFTENSIMLCNELLQNLEANRVKIEQQDLLSTRGSISRKQEDWKVMWENFLGQCPFNLILDQSPVLGLLRALPPCSDVAEEEDEDIDFSPHLFSVSDVCDSVAERRSEKGDGALGTTIDESAAPATCRPGISSVPLELSEASENRDLLIGKVAKAVVSESPQSGEEKGMTMEDLISLLARNPFLTRKEIPRTPENLFNEIRSSWRKATETEGSSDVELAETEVMIEVPVDARLTMQKATDSRFVCSVPASPVPDFDPPLSESKSPLSSMECRPYKQVSGDHVESPVSETSGMQESGERTEAQELKCTVLNKSSVEDPKEHTSQYIKRSMNTEDTGSEHNSRTNVLLSDHCQSSSVRVMHTKPFLVSMSCESAHMGILEETLPELYSAGLNLSASSQSDFGITDSTYITGGSENHGNAETPKLDLQSVSSIYEVLEETPSGSEEKLHQTHNGGETVILATENRYESCGSPKHFCLDEEFTKTPSPESLNEKKNSLSSLLVSCQRLEEMASMVHKIPSDVVRRWKDVCDSVAERRSEKGDGALGTTIDESAAPATCRPGISSVPLELSEASENRDLLIGKNLHTETLKGKEEPVPPEILKDERDESAISETWQNADDRVTQRESPVKKEDPLKKFTEELAEEELPFSNILQVAKAVVSESPQSGEEKGMTMEDLISLLAWNPFLTRKEIPRTPENLFNEIRSSWRKATETEGSSDVELAETEVMIEVPVDARLTMQKATDSRFVCSVPASPVPDFDPPLSESKSPLSSMECRPYKQVSGDHVESPVSETSGMQESGERTEAQELKCTVLNKSSVEDPKEHTSQYIKRSMNTEDTGSEHNSRTNVLLSDHCQSSSVRVMHTKPFLVSMSCESAHMGILEETLPELYSAGLNLSASSQSDFGITDSTYITGGSENHGNAETPKLDLQSVSSIYEVLEETPSGSEEKLHQTHNGGETVILATENRYESCGSPKHFCLDEEFTKTPSPESLNEKKNSLSSLLVSCQRLEEMASMVHKIPSDVVRRWKDVCDSVAERRSEKDDGALGTTIDESAAPATCRPGISSVPLELSEASENRDLLIGKNLHTETLKGKEEPVPPEILKDERDESAISETWQNADDRVTQRESPVKKEDPLKKFTEELAEEIKSS